MSSLSSLEFLLEEAIGNIVRNRLMSIAAIIISAVSLAVAAGFAVSAAAVQRAATTLPQEFEMGVFIKRNIEKARHTTLQAEIQKLPGVKSVEYISAEEGWKELKKDFGESFSTDDVIYNPALAKFRVMMIDPEKSESVQKRLVKMPEIDSVLWRKDEVTLFTKLSRVVAATGALTTAALLVGSLLIIGNTIRLGIYARRREIAIMRMVGARPAFIRLPFLLEGMLLAGLGAAIAAGIVHAAGYYLAEATAKFQTFTRFFDSGIKPIEVTSALLFAGVALGATSSLISIQRYLKEASPERTRK